MSSISYFQRYSQRENHLTNNILLMLRHLYRDSPTNFANTITKLTDKKCNVGIEFQQQVAQRNRFCYDGSMIQHPIDITIETKRLPKLNRQQIEDYVKEISYVRGPTYAQLDGVAILVGLTTREIDQTEYDYLSRFAKERNVHFAALSFQRLLDILKEACVDNTSNLAEIYHDFEEYLLEEGVLEKDIMKAFPCGGTLEFNKRHRMYTVGADTTRYINARFVGFYHDKCISHIGEVMKIVEGTYRSQTRNFEVCEILSPGGDALDSDEINRIRSMNDDHKELADHCFRYFLLGDVFSTTFRKETPYALQRVKNFVLSDWVDDYQNGESTVKDVALALSDKNW